MGIGRADRDRGQAFAVKHRTRSDVRDAGGNGHAGQAGALKDRIIREGVDVGAEGHAGQTGDLIECRLPNGGDWQAIHCVRDGHVTAGTGVLGDGDGAVIGREGELGLDDGGQRQ